MRVRTRAFHVPKQGNAQDEYEDAFFPDGVEHESPEFRCAVADGASESAFSGLWAQLLVRGFGRRRLHLAHLRSLWERAIAGRPLPWFLEKKVHHGAFAALIGLSIRENGTATMSAGADGKDNEPSVSAADWLPEADGGREAPQAQPAGPGWRTEPGLARPAEIAGTWRAVAVGDCCLFQVRADELVTVGPLCRSDQFDNAPFLLGSKSDEVLRRGVEHVSLHGGPWTRRDRFYLVSDALAQWLLLRQEVGHPPWEMLRELGAPDTIPFDELVLEMRSSHGLHNDDTTVLRVEVDE